jgi:hypothetical protein
MTAWRERVVYELGKGLGRVEADIRARIRMTRGGGLAYRTRRAK